MISFQTSKLRLFFFFLRQLWVLCVSTPLFVPLKLLLIHDIDFNLIITNFCSASSLSCKPVIALKSNLYRSSRIKVFSMPNLIEIGKTVCKSCQPYTILATRLGYARKPQKLSLLIYFKMFFLNI